MTGQGVVVRCKACNLEFAARFEPLPGYPSTWIFDCPWCPTRSVAGKSWDEFVQESCPIGVYAESRRFHE